ASRELTSAWLGALTVSAPAIRTRTKNCFILLLASSAGYDIPTRTGRDPPMRLAERANVLSKRAKDERTGHPIDDGGWGRDDHTASGEWYRDGERPTIHASFSRPNPNADNVGASLSCLAGRLDFPRLATVPRPVPRDADNEYAHESTFGLGGSSLRCDLHITRQQQRAGPRQPGGNVDEGGVRPGNT